MRLQRIRGEGRCIYGCHSRAVDGHLIFSFVRGGAKKFLFILARKAAFLGIRILRIFLTKDGFFLLCQVDTSKPLSVKTVLKRIRAYYGEDRVRELVTKFRAVTDPAQRKELIERLLEPYRRRMNDVSILMKEAKGEFAQWYNRIHGRSGVLWAERFETGALASQNPAVIGPDQVEEVVDQENGEQRAAELWRRRIRYLYDGVTL